ncbi:transglutaminase family protein [Novosphingobium umbonatum]|uniref:Transglutaminase family protein n=1 Tax=Novosphingobium umbonatum TaxID=1908524 RepID=A0A437NCY5_9SPHN|nr:transglutaminase family protein [Novosphingobium umbonatum]RVU07777.1 transglutaminase family protein [Novosphingobium umbonatum]
MRINIEHRTHYRFDQPVWHGVQRLRLTPPTCAVQTVQDWQIDVEGGSVECAYDDHNGNKVTLIALGSGNGEVVITARGTVDTRDTAGVVGGHQGFMPLWLLTKQTALTKPGAKLKSLIAQFAPQAGEPIPMLHSLMTAVKEAMSFATGHTDATTSAEAAWAAGKGVCQDYAHIFISVARALGLPARYVSGYLWMEDRPMQDAGHAWAEVHVPGLGWVGFDAANDTCPDERYIRVALGVDYADAAPVTSLSQGGGKAALDVALEVTQQQEMAQ